MATPAVYGPDTTFSAEDLGRVVRWIGNESGLAATAGMIVRLARVSSGKRFNSFAAVAATLGDQPDTDAFEVYGVVLEDCATTDAACKIGLRGEFYANIEENTTNITGTGHPLIVGQALTSATSTLTSALDIAQGADGGSAGVTGLRKCAKIVAYHCDQTAIGTGVEYKLVQFDGISGFGTVMGLAGDTPLT
jgi:hypothetical protein